MNTYLKLGGLLACLLFSSQASLAQSSIYDGLYMGVEGTHSKTKHNNTVRLDPIFEGEVDVAIPSETYRNPIYTNKGYGAGFFIGYRASHNRITLAAEGTYNYNFISRNISPTNYFEITNEFGASIMPGIWMTDQFLIFGQVGFSQLQFNNADGANSFNNSDSGLTFGGGFQIYASEKLSLRASYTRSTHDHNTSVTVTPYIETLQTFGNVIIPIREDQPNVTYQYFNTIKRDKFAVSIVYNF